MVTISVALIRSTKCSTKCSTEIQHFNAVVVRPPRPADSVGGSPSKADGDPALRKSMVAARMRAV